VTHRGAVFPTAERIVWGPAWLKLYVLFIGGETRESRSDLKHVRTQSGPASSLGVPIFDETSPKVQVNWVSRLVHLFRDSAQ
jgi:hypothetical protein